MSKLWPPGGLLLIPQKIHEYRKPRWNDIYRRKRINRRKASPSDTLSITNPTWTNLNADPGLRGERPETNHLSHGTAVYFNIIFNELSNPENLQVYFLDARCKKQLVNKTVSMLVFLRVIFGLVCTRFGGTWCLQLQGRMFEWSTDKCLQLCTVLQPRSPRLTPSPPWDSQISHGE